MKKIFIASPFLLSTIPTTVHADNTLVFSPLTVTLDVQVFDIEKVKSGILRLL